MNKYIIGGVVVLVIALVVLVVLNTEQAVAPTPEEIGAEMDMDSMNTNAGMDTMETTSVGPDTDLSGIHIMADGSVMLGDGTVVSDASVTADGMISLPDGRMVAPAMDMRQ